MEKKEGIVLFIISFCIPLVFYRIYVLLNQGKVSFLRGLTGLEVHHYHYGIILVTIGILLLVFDKLSKTSVVISGLGLGAMLDGFISSLVPSFSRAEEIVNYGQNLLGTLVLFLGVVLIALYLFKRNKLSSESA
jgi:hypothetical protein